MFTAQTRKTPFLDLAAAGRGRGNRPRKVISALRDITEGRCPDGCVCLVAFIFEVNSLKEVEKFVDALPADGGRRRLWKWSGNAGKVFPLD